MTLPEATEGIGKRFKPLIIGARADIIRSIDSDGNIQGDFTLAHHDDCRFIAEQPDQLKRLASDTESFDQLAEGVKQVAEGLANGLHSFTQ